LLGKPQEQKKRPSDALSEALSKASFPPENYEPGPAPVEPYDGKPNPYRTKHPLGKPFLWGDGRDERTLFVAEGPVFVPGIEKATIVAVDTHTEVSYAYCQKGHLHVYHNGKLLVKKRRQQSKHVPEGVVEDYVPNSAHLMGWKDKTVVEVELCND
jgi:hypothetical protein